jgi:capsule biosynthesis phosphatase
LGSLPTIAGDYSTVLPIVDNILLAQELHKAGHHITIQTARRMKTHRGNIGGVLKDVAAVTLKTLEEFNIPYDEIFFGKPYADIYIDDLAVNALLNVKKDLGWYKERAKIPKSMIESRPINTIQIFEGNIIKSSAHRDILGEIFFYSGIPDDCAHLFAKMMGKPEHIENTFSIRMEKINGISFSHLLIGRALGGGKLKKYLNCLFEMHNSNGFCSNPIDFDPFFEKEFASSLTKDLNIYANYSLKLEERVNRNHIIYSSLDPKFSEVYSAVKFKLGEYESNNLARLVNVIHGDPVFSNAILDSCGSIKFFDMRGALGGSFSRKGDCLYDLAKVYQCLFGYDFIVLADESILRSAKTIKDVISTQDMFLLQELRVIFTSHVSQLYGDFLSSIKIVTSSLYLSLLPYHPQYRWKFFLELAEVAYLE